MASLRNQIPIIARQSLFLTEKDKGKKSSQNSLGLLH